MRDDWLSDELASTFNPDDVWFHRPMEEWMSETPACAPALLLSRCGAMELPSLVTTERRLPLVRQETGALRPYGQPRRYCIDGVANVCR